MIELKKIKKSYGNRTVLNDVNLKIEDKDFVFITGKSGAGKSTLLNILALFDSPTSGEYLLDDEDVLSNIRNQPEIRNEKFGFVFQSFCLLEELTVVENIMLPLLYGKNKSIIEYQVDELLSYLNLTDVKFSKVKNISGGEKQRVAFGRAVVCNPKYIFCDEPTGNLDGTNTQIIMDFLDKENRNGKTIIVVTHDVALVNRGNKVYEIDEGELRQIK